MSELQPEQIAEEWNPMAAGYEEIGTKLTGQFSDDAVRIAGIQATDKVLDVAAGTGALSIRAASTGADVLATDFSQGMIEVLLKRAEAEGVTLRTAMMNGQDLSLDDAGFDVGCSMFGLMMFPDRAAGFRELHRVVKPGGRALVGVWSDPKRLEFFSLMLGSLFKAVPDFPPPAKPPSWLALTDPVVLTNEMKAGGFDEVEVHTIQHPWVVESPEWIWDRLEGIAPGVHFIFRRLDEKQKAAFGEAFKEAVRERPHEGGYALKAEAHLALAHKAG